MRYQLPPFFLKECGHEILGNVASKSWQRLRLHLFSGWPLHARIAKSAESRLGHGGFASRRGSEKRAHCGYEQACGDTSIQLTKELAAAVSHSHTAAQLAEKLDELNRVRVFASKRWGFYPKALQKTVHFALKGRV